MEMGGGHLIGVGVPVIFFFYYLHFMESRQDNHDTYSSYSVRIAFLEDAFSEVFELEASAQSMVNHCSKMIRNG